MTPCSYLADNLNNPKAMKHPTQPNPTQPNYKPAGNKIRKPILMGVAFMGLASLLTSCQKEPAAPYSETRPGQVGNVKSLVEAFVNQARNNLVKAGNTISVDSAEWYVEAGLNYSLAKAWIEYDNAQADSVWATIPTSNGSVALADVYSAFNELHDALADIEQEGVQHLALADVSVETVPAGLNLVVRYVVGSGYAKGAPNTNYPPGYALLWWQPGAPNCGCGTYTSTKCADKTIQQRVKAAILTPLQPGDFLTNIETWTVSYLVSTSIPGKTYDANHFLNVQGVPGHSNMDNPIYSCSLPGGDCSSCLDATDLSFHTQGVYNVLMWIRNTHIPSKIPITLSVDGDLGSSSSGSHYIHSCLFTYALKQSGSAS